MRRLAALVASDIHAGAGGSEDLYVRATGRMADELLDLEDQITEDQSVVVLNGDVVDLWRDDHALSVPSTALMLQRLSVLARPGAPVYWVVGNHDAAIPQYVEQLPAGFELCKRLYARLPGLGDVLFTHGDDGDLLNGQLSDFGKAATQIAHGVGSVCPWAERWLADQANRLEGKGRHDKGPLARWAREYLSASHGVTGLVYGHSHVAEYAELIAHRGPLRLWNTGTWLDDGWLRLYDDGTWDRWKLDAEV